MSDLSSQEAADLRSCSLQWRGPIADSPEVREVWDRMADACRTVVPFDAMGIVRLESGGRVRAVAAAGELAVKALESQVYVRADFSPRFWPDEDDFLFVVRNSE